MEEQAAIATIDPSDLARHIEKQDAFAIDLRSHTHSESIYGSIRYDPKKMMEAPRLVLPLPKGSGLIVLYDEDGSSELTSEIAARLGADGYGELRLLAGGFAAWAAAGGKMQDATLEQPVPEVTEHQLSR